FEKNEGIIIMAATNRADVLDPALLRPGRFDRQIYVNIPDVKGREEIFKVHSRNKPLAPDVSFKILARMTSGFSGADIENLLNEAAILAARANRRVIIMEDILEGINKVIAGPQKKSRTITETDKRITAYHEAGHAIVARVLPNCDEVQEVSIVPRGMAAGYTLTRPETDDSHVTKNKLNDTISMMLGGRAAEQIVIHDISTGASNDIERASGIARKMVTEWGMSEKLGNIFLGGSEEVFLGRDYSQHTSYSEAIAGQIDEEVKAIIDSNYQRALQILKDNRNVLDNMVKVLYEKNTIYTEEVDMLFDGKSAEEIIKTIEEKAAKKEEYKKLEQIQVTTPLVQAESKVESSEITENNTEIPH
ncbi:MAG: AAA family ATPase, partial [Clostridia bacterium]|nr:AAA family ATPase [Clostridia bacterium]